MGQRFGAPKKTYVPDDVVFQTKPQTALDLIDRAKADHLTPQWVSDLYNACDWCDALWAQATLSEDVQRVIEQLRQR